MQPQPQTFDVVWFVWGSCGFYVLFREGGIPAWFLGFLYVLPVVFPAIRPVRRAFLSSCAAPLTYALIVIAAALFCTAHQLLAALHIHLSDAKIYMVMIAFWPVSALIYLALFVLIVAALKRLVRSKVT
jgi:hypothetical protein